MKVKIISKNDSVTQTANVEIGRTYKVMEEDGYYYSLKPLGYNVHKSDCEVITDKEIIGYRLKDEKYLKAVKSITGFYLDYSDPKTVTHKGPTVCYDELKEAGVLDLWFEPVYKKETPIEPGRWYKTPAFGKSIFFVTKVTDDDVQAYGFDVNGDWTEKKWCFANPVIENNIPATDKEVEQALIKEAKNRGFKEGVRIKDANYYSNGLIISNNFRYVKEINSLVSDTEGNGDLLFNKGKWAEIISKPELPDIDGYKRELIESAINERKAIKYGCAIIKTDWFTNSENRSIKSMVLDSGVEINETQMNQIREYLND